MRTFGYIALAVVVMFAVVMLAGLGLWWGVTQFGWTHKVFSAGFWTQSSGDARNAVLADVARAVAAAVAA